MSLRLAAGPGARPTVLVTGRTAAIYGSIGSRLWRCAFSIELEKRGLGPGLGCRVPQRSTPHTAKSYDPHGPDGAKESLSLALRPGV
eukprot:3385151-Rhodomonas_salina.1